MNWRKRWSALFLAASLLLACIPGAGAAQTEEYLTRGETAGLLLEAAQDYNPDICYGDILQGYPNGDLDEQGLVTRVQALVMLQRAFGGLPEPKGDNARSGCPTSGFTDVPAWAAEELAEVFAAGIVAGTTETTFSPGDRITREQLDLLLRRTFALEGSSLKDDFYAAVNKQALDNSQILPGYPGTGAFTDLSVSVQNDVTAIIQELVQTGGKTAGEKKIVTLYQNILDIDARNSSGITPIRPYLTAIDQAQTLEELMAAHVQVQKDLAASPLLDFGLTVDARDSSAFLLTFDGLSPMLGQSGYGAGASETQKQAYKAYLETLFTLSGQSKEEAARAAALIWQTDPALAAASLTTQELADVDKTYHIYTMDQLRAMFPGAEMDALFAASGLEQTDRILVSDPGKLQAIAALFDPERTPNSLEILKSYARLTLLNTFGPMLGQAFTDAASTFQQSYLGIAGGLSLEGTASQYIQAFLGDYLGKVYADRYFSASAKKEVESMARDILAVYRDRIQALDWMSSATKAKAIRKLDTMTLHIGYPDTWEDPLEGVNLLTAGEGGSFFQNAVAIVQAGRQALAERQQEGPDKDQWVMTPYTVNACYTPTENTITFPAGILQPPFYDKNASYEENLGSIGYVIAHEITHAFDNNGAKFDENGNAAGWWTAADYAAFQALCQRVVTLYDGRESAPGIVCNGELTLSENIADLGAAACITQLEGKQKNPDYAALYTAMARIWCSSYPREMRQYMARMDVHAPDKLRGSLVLQNFDQFYEAFDITEGDGMWLAPEDRVVIW